MLSSVKKYKISKAEGFWKKSTLVTFHWTLDANTKIKQEK